MRPRIEICLDDFKGTDPGKQSPGSEDRPLLLPTGSTLLNLALSDSPWGGYCPGSIVNIVGDSSAGKTFLLWTLYAELTYDDRFHDYRLIFDEPEAALHFDLQRLFGTRVEERVERGSNSVTIEDMFNRVSAAIEDGRPFVYGIDSFDALTSIAEQERKIEDGSYKTEKPRLASEILRRIMGSIERTRSVLVVVSQTRDAIGVAFGDKKTRSGGRALRFYSSFELWLAIKGHIKKPVRGKDRETGVNVIAKIKKNKLTGRLATVELPIVWSYGVDDVTSQVNWLIEEGEWKKFQGYISSPWGRMKQENLVQHIEGNGLQKVLTETTVKVWREIVQAIRPDRPPKYAEVES